MEELMTRRTSGAVLRRCRDAAGLTQTQVAEQVRNSGTESTLSEPHYRRIENNLAVPSVLLAMDIATVVDSDVYEIWG